MSMSTFNILALQDFAGSIVKTLQDPKGFNVDLKNFQDADAFPKESHLMAQYSKPLGSRPAKFQRASILHRIEVPVTDLVLRLVP